MSDRQPAPSSKETPMERIFRKVVGRKMTSHEKACFRLKNRSKPSRKSAPREQLLGRPKLQN
jgi:hypothetical protein